MISRLRRSLAFRLPRLYRGYLELRRPGRLAARPGLPLTLLYFTGRDQLSLLRESLLSVHRAWPRLPELAVVSDGTLERADVEAFLPWWPGSLTAYDWRELLPNRPEGPDELLARFAGREVMGRKLSAIVALARRGPVLYSDTDVLWFRYPRWLEPLLESEDRPTLVVSRDTVRSYDDRLVPDRLPRLAEPPYLCAGLLFARGDVLRDSELEPILAFAAEGGVARTEQTLIAAAARRLGRESLPEDEVTAQIHDRFSLRPTFRHRPWAARHYVITVRHLFWLDALALRAARRPGGPPRRGTAPLEGRGGR